MKMGPPEGMQQPSEPRIRLAQARMRLKLSQKQVAERVGTTFVNVSRWERGITKPSPYFRRRLVQLYGKTEEELDLAQSPIFQTSSLAPTSSPASFPGDRQGRPGMRQGRPYPDAPPVPDVQVTATATPISDPTIPLPPANPLVGRDKELVQLKQRLRSGSNITLTALNGLPGVGKTTLAITIAHDPEMRAYFYDGILWAGLGPQPNMPGILSHWAGLLGISQPEISALNDAGAWAIALRRAIGSRRMLLVIDDAWSQQDALALKIGGPNCAHLITTRYPSIANQLGIDSAVTIEELNTDESVVLLRILAPRITEHELKRAHELAEAVGGLPLALTLIGNYLRRHTYSGQPRRVEAALARLSDAVERLHISEPRGPVERHPSLAHDTPVSLQSVIAVSDAQLDAEQQAALRALSVFPPKPGSFSEEAALAVANCSAETLDYLVDTGLLEYSETGHYTMHQTIADYAGAHLNDDTPYARLADYMAQFVSDNRKNYALLEQESGSILAALEAAYRLGKDDALMRCIYAYIPYLRSRGLYSLAETHLQRAKAAAERSNDAYGKAGALLYLGEIAQKQGNYEQASASLREGLELARQTGEKERITALLADLGWVTWKRGEYARAEEYLQEGRMLAREIDNKEHICDILETLGSVAASRGEYDKSMQYMEEALKLAREIGDSEKMCTLLINLGVTEGERGNYSKAEAFLMEGLRIARKIGHLEWVGLLLINLGDVLGEQGNFIRAEEYLQEGLKLARELEHREWMSVLLINLGSNAQKQKKYIMAKDYLHEALELARLLGIPNIICNALYELGNLSLSLQNLQLAKAYYLEILITAPEGGQELKALAQYGLAQIYAMQNAIYEALKLGEESMAMLESIGHRGAKDVHIWLDSLTN